MNLRDLKYLVAVADTQHFSKAADQCFVSQPTLSGQIKKLEQELGICLFERTKRSVETTPMGEAIVAQARRVLEQADGLRQLAQSYQDPLVGPLRMGVIPSLSPYIIPLILKPLNKQYGQMKLVISEELTDTLLQRLSKHEIDAALLATQVDDPDFHSIELFDEPFWLAHPVNHALSQRKTIRQSDLNSADLLLLAEGHCLADQAMEVCNWHNREAQDDLVDLRAASLETLLRMVAAGFGSTLIPALALETASAKDKDISIRPLNLPDTYRRISLVFRNTFPRRQAIDAFAGIVLDNLPQSVQLIKS